MVRCCLRDKDSGRSRGARVPVVEGRREVKGADVEDGGD